VKALKNGEEKNRNLRWKNEKKKKTEGAIVGTYIAVLPTDIKLIIILIYYVGEVSKMRW
jgi:hypothetical protein